MSGFLMFRGSRNFTEKLMKHGFTFILLLLTFSFEVGAQNDFQGLDNYFDSISKYNKAMGTVALAKQGRLIYLRSFGFADIEKNVHNNDSTEYRIGSITKTFTAVLVLKTVEKNKLSLDETIDKWFPSIKNAEKITVSDLLYHRSGIHNFTDDTTYLNWNTQAKTHADMLKLIEKGGSDFQPGSKIQYSNSNYVLLTIILEKTNHKTYEQLLQNNIITPLQLSHTYLGRKINPSNNESFSYEYNGVDYVKSSETDMSIPLGAGAIVSNPVDLIKFINAIFSGNLLTKNSLNAMTTLKDNFGMGLFQMPFGNKKAWAHTGGIDGFRSVVSYFPSDSISYALCINGSAINPNDISIAALSAANGLAVKIPDFTIKSLSTEELKKFEGIYSSTEMPMKITITVKDGMLIGQATGQSQFVLEFKGENSFGFDAAGLILDFQPEENIMILKQAGRTFKFLREQ